jgi:hypothetical protein
LWAWQNSRIVKAQVAGPETIAIVAMCQSGRCAPVVASIPMISAATRNVAAINFNNLFMGTHLLVSTTLDGD